MHGVEALRLTPIYSRLRGPGELYLRSSQMGWHRNSEAAGFTSELAKIMQERDAAVGSFHNTDHPKALKLQTGAVAAELPTIRGNVARTFNPCRLCHLR